MAESAVTRKPDEHLIAAPSIAEQIDRIREKNMELLGRLDESERRFRRISRGVLRMQEEERSRLSRDLHDGVGQLLTALRIQLELLERETDLGTSPFAPRLIAVRKMSEQCLHDVRHLSRILRPPMLDELGILPTLRWFIRTFQEQTSIKVSLECQGDERRLDADMETLLYRVAQEALTNVAKHAKVDRAQVSVVLSARRMRLRIEDDGAGFDAAPLLGGEDERGFGVRSMRDRVQFHGGRFSLSSSPGHGTTVEVEVDATLEEAPR